MEQRVAVTSKAGLAVKDTVLTGLLIALVFVATKFINVRLPVSINGGLIHLGNVALFMTAIVFGRKKGAFAGAFGMGLFDIVSGWLPWAPFTFVVRGVMGYVIGRIAYAKDAGGKSLVLNVAAILAGSIWMIAGYYLTEVILYGNWIAPVTSIPGNITQIVLGAVLGLPLAATLKKFKIGQ